MNRGCEFHEDALTERAAGRLHDERAPVLDAHLAECPDCTATLAALVALRAAPLQVPPGLEARIREAVREVATPAARPLPAVGPSRRPVHRIRWRTWALPLAAAAALALVWVGVGTLGGPGNGAEGLMAAFEDFDPFGAWPADGVIVAGEPLLSELSIEELEHLLREMGS